MALSCDIALEELDLSLPTYAGVKRAEIDSVADLVAMPSAELAQRFRSTPKSLGELREAVKLHARRVLVATDQYQLVSELPLSWLEPPCELQALLQAQGVRTFGGLAEARAAGLTKGPGETDTDALLTRFYAYCAVRGRDEEGPSSPSWVEQRDSADFLLGLYQSDVRGPRPLNRADEVLVAAKMRGRQERDDEQNAADGTASEQPTPQRRSAAREKARTALVEAALAWVVEWATGYTGRDVDLMDLIQEGNLALIKALDGFDYRQGQRFHTYAWWWARQMMNRYVDEQRGAVRVPAHVAEALRRYDDALDQLWEGLGREPTVEDLAERLGLLSTADSSACRWARMCQLPLGDHLRTKLRKAADRVARLAALGQEPVSLDATVRDQVREGDGCLKSLVEAAGLSAQEASRCCMGDLVPCEEVFTSLDEVAEEKVKGQIGNVLSALTPRERGVLEERFGLRDGEERTLEEVGQIFGVTRERVRQIQEKALRKLRHPRVRRQLRFLLQ